MRDYRIINSIFREINEKYKILKKNKKDKLKIINNIGE